LRQRLPAPEHPDPRTAPALPAAAPAIPAAEDGLLWWGSRQDFRRHPWRLLRLNTGGGILRLALLLGLIASPALAQTQDDILRAQTEVVTLGYDLTADRENSVSVTAAIKACQRDWQLPEDGVWMTRSMPA